MNLFDLVETDGITLKKATSTEYAGACPSCRGTDRFRVWPGKGRWMCRGCGKHGDVIDYLREMRGLSFKEAAEEAGRNDLIDDSRQAHPRPAPIVRAWEPKAESFPCREWQEKAGAFVAWAHDRLMKEPDRLKWLSEVRGITIETAKAFRLGWNPTDLYRDRTAWGIQPESEAVKILLPAGLVIPAFRGSELVRVRVRRENPPEGEPRYRVVKGSSSAPLIAGSLTGSVVVVESDLDALMIHQETGAGVVALGSSEVRPDLETFEALRGAGAVFVALDSDQAGGKAAWGWWASNMPASTRLPIPPELGKDPNEARQNGMSIREWVDLGEELRREEIDRSGGAHGVEKGQGRETVNVLHETQPAPPNAESRENTGGKPSAESAPPDQAPISYHSELITERAAIREYDGGQNRESAERAAIEEAGPCFLCGGVRFWVSTFGVIVCERCHPPATEKIIERTYVLRGEKVA